MTDDLNDAKLNLKLRQDSGSIDIRSKLVEFLYLLMRDHVAFGKVESLVREAEISFNSGDGINAYSNGYLALYAENLANRLTSK